MWTSVARIERRAVRQAEVTHDRGTLELRDLPTALIEITPNVVPCERGANLSRRRERLFRNRRHVADVDRVVAGDHGNVESRLELGFIPARECAPSVRRLEPASVSVNRLA